MKIEEAIKETGMASLGLGQSTINYYARKTNFSDYVWCDVYSGLFVFYVADYELQYDTWIPYKELPVLIFKPKNIKVEYIANNEPTISYSDMRNFLKCERLYCYTSVVGYELIEKSDALNINSYVGSVLSRKEVNITGEENTVWLQKANAIIDGMAALEITKHIVNQDFEPQEEFLIQQDGLPRIHGFIDFHHVSSRFFLKLETTKRIDDYKQDKFKFKIEDQCGMYFLSNPAYEFCVILPIKIPELEYNENKETILQYYDRCLTDITNRPRHYFVNYNYETKKFGIKLYRQEIDENELIKLCKWTTKSIQRCAKENYWPMRKGSCFSPIKCDFYEACSVGISEDRYKKREKK